MMSQRVIKFFTEDRPVAIVISLNAIVLFFLSFDGLGGLGSFLSILDAIFLFYFILEAFIKVRLMGWKTYISRPWNQFDFFILLFSIPSLILLFEHKFPDVSFIFVFRVVRTVRFFKFIKFIPNIQELIAGVRRAFKASVFVLLAFFIYSFVISLVSCRMFKDYSPELFGDPFISFYNIFKIFTIEGWYEVPEQLVAQSGMGPIPTFFTKMYFILIVISGGLFGLSIVNAIFVEEMVRDNNDELEMKVDDINRKVNDINRKFNMLLKQQNSSFRPPKSE